jgi:hypothetical protein
VHKFHFFSFIRERKLLQTEIAQSITAWTAGVLFPANAGLILIATASKQDLRATQPLLWWIWRSYSQGLSDQGVNLTTGLYFTSPQVFRAQCIIKHRKTIFYLTLNVIVYYDNLQLLHCVLSSLPIICEIFPITRTPIYLSIDLCI